MNRPENKGSWGGTPPTDLLHAGLAGSEHLVIIQDLEGRYLYYNGSPKYGIDAESITGRLPSALFDAQTAARLEARVAKVAATGMRLEEDSFLTWEGREFCFHDELQPIRDGQGRTVAVFTVGVDVTGQRREAESLRRRLGEKELLLRETQHRVKNNFSSLSAMLSLQADAASSPEAATALRAAIGRIESLLVLYERMLEAEGRRDIAVDGYLGDIVDTVLSQHDRAKDIVLDKRLGDFSLEPGLLLPLGIVLNEFLTNTMKYAFPDGGPGKVSVVATRRQGVVTLRVSDNGRGIPRGATAGRGLGLNLVGKLAAQLGGEFEVRRDRGTRATLSFRA